MPMRHRLFTLLFLIVVGSIAVLVGLRFRVGRDKSEANLIAKSMECGHWAVLRACELMGVPASPGSVQARMPLRPEGHSLQDLAEALDSAGLASEGRKEGIEAFLAGGGVRIVHLSDPDHFIVVTKAGSKSVTYFDHQGRRQLMPLWRFAARWSGYVLHVRRPQTAQAGFFPPPKPGVPRIEFNTLLIDKGDLVTGADCKKILFEFPFVNRGAGPLLLKKVHPGCSCLKALFPNKPLPPGGKGVVSLHYSINPSIRSFVHEAVVETNDPAFPRLVLRAAGNTDVLVTVSPSLATVGDVPWGSDQRVFLVVRYSGEEDFEMSRAIARHSAVKVHFETSEELAERLALGARMPSLSASTRIIEIRIPTDRLGPFADEVTISTNIERFRKIHIPVQARIVPPVVASPSLLSFGEVVPGDALKRSVELIHHQGKPFRILSLKPETVGLSWARAGDALRFKAEGAAALKLNGTNLVAEIETDGMRFGLEIPVFAARKPGS